MVGEAEDKSISAELAAKDSSWHLSHRFFQFIKQDDPTFAQRQQTLRGPALSFLEKTKKSSWSWISLKLLSFLAKKAWCLPNTGGLIRPGAFSNSSEVTDFSAYPLVAPLPSYGINRDWAKDLSLRLLKPGESQPGGSGTQST